MHNIPHSISGKGNCYDNAQAESFLSRFKAEPMQGRLFESVGHAQSKSFAYIEGYNNRIRKHSSFGYLSQIQFERAWKIEQTTIS